MVEKDLSQKWLSEQIGKSFSTTNAYCCNRQQPNLETLYKIAQLLSVELKELIVDNLGESPLQKKRTVKNDSLLWAILGLRFVSLETH